MTLGDLKQKIKDLEIDNPNIDDDTIIYLDTPKDFDFLSKVHCGGHPNNSFIVFATNDS